MKLNTPMYFHSRVTTSPTPKYRQVLTYVATLINPYTLKVAASINHPDEQYSKAIGNKIALDRFVSDQVFYVTMDNFIDDHHPYRLDWHTSGINMKALLTETGFTYIKPRAFYETYVDYSEKFLKKTIKYFYNLNKNI